MQVLLLDVVAFTAALGWLFMLLGLLLLRLTLTRRVKRELKPKGEYWETGTLDFGFLNTALFALACVLPFVRQSEMFRLLYPDMNVKKYMNWLERAFSYGVIGGLIVCLMLGVVFVLIEP